MIDDLSILTRIGMAERFNASIFYITTWTSEGLNPGRNNKSSESQLKSDKPKIMHLPFIPWATMMPPTYVGPFELGK